MEAVEAKHRLSRCMVFWCKTIVDWVDPELEPDVQQIAKVRRLFIRRSTVICSTSVHWPTYSAGTVRSNVSRTWKITRSYILNVGRMPKTLWTRWTVPWAKRPASGSTYHGPNHSPKSMSGKGCSAIENGSSGCRRSKGSTVPSTKSIPSSSRTIRTNDTTVSAFASNTEIGSTVRYSNYDHFEHDFGRQTFESITYRVRRNVEAVTVQRKPRNYEEFVAHNIETLTIQ